MYIFALTNFESADETLTGKNHAFRNSYLVLQGAETEIDSEN